MRSALHCATATCLCLVSLSFAQAATFDGNPYSLDWATVTTPEGDVQIGNTGDAIWDGVWLLRVNGLGYEQVTGQLVAIAGGTELQASGETAEFVVSHVMSISSTQGQVIIQFELTPKVAQPASPRFEVMITGFNTNPRFDSMQGGEAVTGRMMDLSPDNVLSLESYFEVGPAKTERGESGGPWAIRLVEISTNLTLRALGMPMEDYGLQGSSVWAEPDGVNWQVGVPVTFEITASQAPDTEPRQHAAAGARSVTVPRVWEFLENDPPARVGAWDFEMRPADRHAPVFGSQEQPAMLIRWRPVGPDQPITASLRVDDAYTGTEAFTIGSLQATQDPGGWYEARVNLDVPAGSVYDCHVQLVGTGGLDVVTNVGEIVRTANLPQPLISAAPPQWALVETIDCTEPPVSNDFYSASGESQIVTGPAGEYRITGNAPGDWFGYRFDVPQSAKVMRIEVDYPDDASRDAGVGVNEPIEPGLPGQTWGQIRTSSGYFSGLVFPVSNRMRTFEAIYFPNSPWATVEVMNTATGVGSAPAAVREIRLYQLEGELPQLPGYEQPPERIFATYTEQGQIAAMSFNTDPTQRGGHGGLGFAPVVTDKVPKEHFYRHWYQVVAQHVRYLRYRGDTGYLFGAVMYTTSRYPSRYMVNRTGYADARFDPAALYAALFGDNGLQLLFTVELTADYRMYQSLYLTDYEVRQGAESSLSVTSEGRQRRLGGMTHSPTMNYVGDALAGIYGDIACELAEYYDRYPGAVGVVSHSGGLWAPMYFVEDVPLNDNAAAAFTAFSGLTLPGDGNDPDRFAERWQWIQANAAEEWQGFRAVLLRDIHAQIAQRLHQASPHWQYVVSQYGSGYDAYIKGQSTDPLGYELKAGFDPRLYRDIENVNFSRHFWGIYRALTQPEWLPILDVTGPLGEPGSPATLFRDYALDPQLAAAFEGHPRTCTLIHAQFDEHMSWTHFSPDRPWLYMGIQPNIQYPQPVDSDMQFEFALAYAQNTPNDVFYLWADGAVQMGHEPRMQAIAAFLRALPTGDYQNDLSVAPPVYVRRLQAAGEPVFYAVNTSREYALRTVTVDAVAVRDRVSGEVLPVNDGAVCVSLGPFGLRVLEAVAVLPPSPPGANVLFSEPFDDLDAWTVVDADGIGAGSIIEAIGGVLHVRNASNLADVTTHGLYAGQVVPSGNARVYFWGINAVGSRNPGQANNGNGPVGTFNLSVADGVQDGFGGNTPLGVYVRNRLVGTYQGEVQRIIENNNPLPFIVMDEGVSYDFYIFYGLDQVGHYYKLSSSDTWTQIDSSESVTLSGCDLYLNVSAWSDFYAGSGEGADWTMEQIDVALAAHPILTSPYEPPSAGTVMTLQ